MLWNHWAWNVKPACSVPLPPPFTIPDVIFMIPGNLTRAEVVKLSSCTKPLRGVLVTLQILSSNHTSPASPPKVPTHPNSQSTPSPLINRPLRHPSLCFYPLHHPLQLRLDHNPTNNHLRKCRMQRFEIKDQIQLTDILKQPIQRLNINLYQINQCQW